MDFKKKLQAGACLKTVYICIVLIVKLIYKKPCNTLNLVEFINVLYGFLPVLGYRRYVQIVEMIFQTRSGTTECVWLLYKELSS